MNAIQKAHYMRHKGDEKWMEKKRQRDRANYYRRKANPQNFNYPTESSLNDENPGKKMKN